MSNLVIEILLKKRGELMAELEQAKSRLEKDIEEINSYLIKLTGKPLPEIESEYRYDDENPDYIKGSIED